MDPRGVARDLSAKMLLNLLSPTGDALDKLRAGRIASAPRIESICGAHQLAALDARDLRDDQDRHREHDVVIAEPGGRVLHDAGRGRVEAALAPEGAADHRPGGREMQALRRACRRQGRLQSQGQRQRAGPPPHGYSRARALLMSERSRTNCLNASSRSSSSCTRKSADGWSVANTYGASALSTNAPRCLDTLKSLPITALAAVEPRHTMTCGFTAATSPCSHWWQASISRCAGVLWRRRLPRSSHLKCFTAFVT